MGQDRCGPRSTWAEIDEGRDQCESLAHLLELKTGLKVQAYD